MDILKSPQDYANELIYYGWTLEDVLNPQASSMKNIRGLHNEFAMRNADYKAEIVTHMKKYFAEPEYKNFYFRDV